MDTHGKTKFDPAVYLGKSGPGRTIIRYKAKSPFFTQGDAANFVIYIHAGRAKLTVDSERGKVATIALLADRDFVGEEGIARAGGLRHATATALAACTTLRIERAEMVRVLHEEPAFSDFFLRYMLARQMRTQADLIDLLFNSTERRLARILLLIAGYSKASEPEALIPSITQTTLAELIGTTRSRVSYFMNRFRKLGFIEYEYKGRILVHKSLLNVILRDRLPEENSSRPMVLDSRSSGARTGNRPEVA